MPVRWLTGLIILALLGTATPSLAKNKAAARDAFARGIEHYNLGEFKDALAAFKDAYRNYNDPSFLFNIGQCQRQLGEKREAVLAYKAYLRESPQAPNRNDVQSLVTALETALADEEHNKSRPPEGTIVPPAEMAPTAAPPETTPPHLTASATPAPAPSTPVYKRWWLWTAVGVVAAGAAVGLGVGLTRPPSYPSAPTSNGTFAF